MQDHPFGVTICDRTIRVHGDLDMAVADQLIEAISCLAESVDDNAIVVDMSRMTFVDSEGLAALIGAHQALDAMGKDLVLQNVPNQAHKTMVICGLVDQLNVQSTVES